jgi:hypothetical protein
LPWSPTDAPRHTKAASTPALQRLWAKVANEQLEESGDEARAIRVANATVKRHATPHHRFV